MRLIKYVSRIAFPIIFLGIILTEMGFKNIGFKLYAGGSLIVGMFIGMTLLFSVRTDY